ncbi:Pantoate--beta-alanine ligase [Vigna angularis]|uniref:Pantoate--beta-alanine ligase n=1 Tax=Phaseolus angularis TaxID=3914 RepID=A0A8T0K2Q2_PHAAN|nr:Pantoate--beta-alanine ligase [Vigna angularis]
MDFKRHQQRATNGDAYDNGDGIDDVEGTVGDEKGVDATNGYGEDAVIAIHLLIAKCSMCASPIPPFLPPVSSVSPSPLSSSLLVLNNGEKLNAWVDYEGGPKQARKDVLISFTLAVKKMVRYLDFSIKVIGAEITRDSDGLAMSSPKSETEDGEVRCEKLSNLVIQCIGEASGRIDYVEGVMEMNENEPGSRLRFHGGLVAVVDAHTIVATWTRIGFRVVDEDGEEAIVQWR